MGQTFLNEYDNNFENLLFYENRVLLAFMYMYNYYIGMWYVVEVTILLSANEL